MKSLNTAFLRSTLYVLVGLIAYFLFLAVGAGLLLTYPIRDTLRMLIIVSPVVPVAFVILSVIQLLQRSDELQQRIQLFAIGFSAVATSLLTFAYGLWESYGNSHFPTALILPLMVILWIIGMIYFRWRFR